ncbi:MAG: NUDIX hydrolase [Planctomycetota bacterium]
MSDLDAQLRERLAPVGDWAPTRLRRAAVLCPLIRRDGADHLLLGLRPLDSATHPGQIAFPGGKVEDDERPVETALRECEEEVGMPPGHVTPLGELPPRESTSRFFVHCVVGRVAPFELRLSPREVDRVIYGPRDELRDPGRWRVRPPPGAAPGGAAARSPQFRHGGDLVWGLTGSFVRDLVGRLGGGF